MIPNNQSIYTYDRLDTKQRMMLEIAKTLQKLQETIDHYDRLEKNFKSEHLSKLLEEISNKKTKEKNDDDFPITFNRREFLGYLEGISEFTDFFKEQFDIIKKYHKEIKAASYFYEDDPISEKIRNLNSKVKQLMNRNQDLENRNLILSNEQNVNLKLKGEIKQLNLELRQKDEFIRLLKSQISDKEDKIFQIQKEVENLNRKNDILNLNSKNMKKTLEMFNILGSFEEGSEQLDQKNKFIRALSSKKAAGYICSFLLPSEINELSFVSKFTFSLIRNSPGFIRNLNYGAMFDKHNIKYTTVKSKI